MSRTFLKAFKERQDKAISRVDIRKGTVGDKQGFCFDVFWHDRKHSNFTSALYKTHAGTVRKVTKYLRTGEFSLYGNAE